MMRPSGVQRVAELLARTKAAERHELVQVASSRVLIDGRTAPGVVELETTLRGAVVRRVLPFDVGDDVRLVDVGDAVVAPAPLDLHLHGAGGVAVPPAGDVAELDAVLHSASVAAAWSHPQLPTPAYDWVATLPVPGCLPLDPIEHVEAAARALSAASGSTRCVGMRVEGMFLARQHAGTWPPEWLRAPDVELLERLWQAGRDAGVPLRIVDVSPELPGALELVRRARELDVVASIAHSGADWETACAAIDAGATLATHVWNAMRPLAHRDPGVVAAVLSDRRVTCELVCDGVHLHHGTVAMSAAACGPGGWVAVSDASPFAGCAPGDYDWAGIPVHSDGGAIRDGEGRLAGSAALLDHGVGVLREVGMDDVAIATALGAAPRRVLDPRRPLGLVAGDPAWVLPRWTGAPVAAPGTTSRVRSL